MYNSSYNGGLLPDIIFKKNLNASKPSEHPPCKPPRSMHESRVGENLLKRGSLARTSYTAPIADDFVKIQSTLFHNIAPSQTALGKRTRSSKQVAFVCCVIYVFAGLGIRNGGKVLTCVLSISV